MKTITGFHIAGKIVFAFVCTMLIGLRALAQLPNCSSGLVYYTTGSAIYNYDPSQPISSTNPSLNTITPPNGGIALAVSDNLNAASPSPTFYTVVSNIYYYYNGSSWVSTGHTAGGVNIGAGGPYIYSFTPSDVYRYDGTANATLVTNISSFSGGGPYDLVGDCAGNFYVLKITTTPYLNKYDPNGNLLTSWTVSGATSTGAGGGFAIIGNDVYFNNGTGLWHGVISGTNVSCTIVTSAGLSPNPSDFASCAIGGTSSSTSASIANVDTAYYCSGAAGTMLYATGPGPFTWTVVSGPAVINGSGDPLYASAAANSTIAVSTTDTSCGTHTDTVTLLVLPTPTISATSFSPVCTGNTLSLVSNSTPPASRYHWTGPGGFSGSSQNTLRSNVNLADSGYYYVSDTLNGCYSFDSVFVSVHPSPAIPTASNNSPICAGDTLKLISNCTTAGVTYTWTGPNSYASASQNPVIPNAAANSSGNYSVAASIGGCSSSTSILAAVNPVLGPPSVTISISPNDTICVGDNVTLSAIATNAGSPAYQWRRNGANIAGATSPTFTTASISNGDIIRCHIISNAPCQAVDTANSNSITVHVIILPPPTLSVTSFPSNYVTGDTVTFTGHVPNGSTGLTYQWKKNGFDITGANAIFYTSTNVSLGDSICLVVHSSVPVRSLIQV